MTGGKGNLASDQYSSVSGGLDNIANYLSPRSVPANQRRQQLRRLGYRRNPHLASGIDAAVSGGVNNTASGEHASILGGSGVTAATTNATSP